MPYSANGWAGALHRFEMIYLGNRTLADAKATLELYQARMRERLAASEPLYLEIDPHLGWRLQPCCRHPKWPYTTDAFGNRRSAPAEYVATSAYRVAIAGNSYVHCDEAPDDKTWVWLLQQNLGRDYRVHNLGVTAYSTDQAFLRLEEFAQANPLEMAVLTVTTTDFYRNLNMCRAFIINDFEVPLYKPRFVSDGNGLELMPAPASTLDSLCEALTDRETLGYLRANDKFFPTAGRQAAQILRRLRVPVRDVWQRNYSEGVAITARICDHFIEWCDVRGITPVLLMLPVYWGAFPAGREFDFIRRQFQSRAALIDAREVFTDERLRMPRSALAHRFNHYTPQVSAWLAEYIALHLRIAANRSFEAA